MSAQKVNRIQQKIPREERGDKISIRQKTMNKMSKYQYFPISNYFRCSLNF